MDPRPPVGCRSYLAKSSCSLKTQSFVAGVVAVEADDLLARVAVRVELEGSPITEVYVTWIDRRRPDLLAKVLDVGAPGAGPLQGVEDDLGAGVARARVAGRIGAVLGLVLRRELGPAGEVADRGRGRDRSSWRRAGEVQERVLGRRRSRRRCRQAR